MKLSRRRKLAVLCLLSHRSKKKRSRSVWVHPILNDRQLHGAFYTLFLQLRNDENKFFNYFRMSTTTFDELLHKIRGNIQGQDTNMRNCIQPQEMLAVTLRYLASGNTFIDLHYAYRLGRSTIAKVVKLTCNAIWTCLAEECIPKMTTESCEVVAAGFKNKANFPHCIGAVDGKHIRIVKPELSGSMFFNYKGYFSVILMAVADSNYKFLYVDIGAYGSECDPTVFNLSSLWQSIEDNSILLPQPKPLEGTMAPDIPYYLIGDEAFGLNMHLQKPYGGKQLTVKKRIFNYRLSRARRYVECAFGILTNKWRIFHRPLNLKPQFCVSVVKACVILHNLVRMRDGWQYEDTMEIVGLEDIDMLLKPNQALLGSKRANSVRNVLADYFLTDVGSVSWQMSRI